MENFELKRHIEQADDPEVLKQTLFALLDKIDSLEQRLSSVGEKEGSEGVSNIIEQKRERLDLIRHGLTELNERMQKPYVVSAELEAVKEVLDVLSEVGECNSVILEGGPGTGKTQWAYSEVGQELQDGKDVSLVHVRVKDTMRAQDLLYSIDDVRRLSDAQAQAQVPDEIRQEAAEWKQKIVSGEVNPSEDEEYKAFKAKMGAVVELGETAKDLDYLNYVDLGPLGEAIYQSGKGQKVYLVIDEIEKGREELMTGILDEIENLTFTVGETGTVIKGDKKNLRIVITTNTEDSDKIPPSFRRRSLYHFIDYPGRADMAQIVELNFPELQKELLDYAISVFYQYHENPEIEKKPSTPELLAWIRVLSKNFDGSIPDDVPHKEILLKYQEDQDLDIGRINVEAYEEVEQAEKTLPHFVQRAFRGDQIYHVTDRINEHDSQDEYAKFYAGLQNEGINFITPKFGEEYDNYYGEYRQKVQRPFQIVMPGVEHLGNGYYVIPEEKLPLLDGVIDTQTEVLPAGQTFTSVSEKSGDVTVGKIEIDGYQYEAYMGEDGRVVVNRAYNRE
jgi:MoxR-like ATPase